MRKHIDQLIEDGYSSGFACGIKKYPRDFDNWQKFSNTPPTKEELDRWPRHDPQGMCIFTGYKNLEMLDLDSKNHPDPDYFRATFNDHLKRCFSAYDKLIIESTISGGLHYYYIAPNETTSRKLAMNATLDENGKPTKQSVLIETRGKGGLSICAPTPGYCLMQNDWNDLAELDAIEYEELLDICKSYSMVPDEAEVEREACENQFEEDLLKPGDDFGWRGDVLGLMQSHGWKICGEKNGTTYLRRPGKEDNGISATWNYKGLNRLYVFSTSTCFDEGRLIKPFHIYATLEHDGDHDKASKALRALGYGKAQNVIAAKIGTEKDKDEVRKILVDNVNLIQSMNDVDFDKWKIEIMSKHRFSESRLDQIKKIKCSTAEVKPLGWQTDLEKNKTDDTPKAKLHNLMKILECDPDFKGSFGYNVLKQKVSARRKISANSVKYDEVHGLLLDDELLAYLLVRVSDQYRVDFSKEQLINVLSCISQKNRFNPLTEALDKCADEWDGQERVDTWLHDFCGAEAGLYTEIIGKKWLIGAVARAYNPGCKVDNTLILEGKQGTGKSTFFRNLSMGFFTDAKIDIKNKDGMINLFGNWFIEFSDLDGLLRVSPEETKSFLSRTFDEFRMPHDKMSTRFERMCIFCGTTNEDQYLSDTTGNRRFWTVKIDTARMPTEEQVKQIWGEVVHMYKAGETWWFDINDKFLRIVEEEQGNRQIEDSREERIIPWFEGRDCKPFLITELWEECFKGKMSDRSAKSLGRTFGPILRGLGFERKNAKIDGICKKIWELADSGSDD